MQIKQIFEVWAFRRLELQFTHAGTCKKILVFWHNSPIDSPYSDLHEEDSSKAVRKLECNFHWQILFAKGDARHTLPSTES